MISINLIPDSVKIRLIGRARVRRIALAMAITGVVVLSLKGLILTLSYAPLEEQALLDDEIRGLEASVESKRAELAAIQPRVEKVRRRDSLRKAVPRFIEVVAGAIPERVSLLSFIADSKGGELRGFAADGERVAHFINRLQEVCVLFQPTLSLLTESHPEDAVDRRAVIEFIIRISVDESREGGVVCGLDGVLNE